ncbi:MAG TPA: HupE/UreJ family protein [Ensifer sp.]|jgi:hydrogenase/urease accessory protein HupE|uniref:HupE/UreJ family protein n=1 Tax=Ensifer sp. TaxID=1872086 RepID=UPI002E140CF7|nr:HupE/UreJ family protein [Ensifer sp.]
MKRFCIALLATMTLFAHAAFAHEVRPAYLEIRPISAERFFVLFKVPALAEAYRLGLYLRLPDNTRDLAPPQVTFEAGAHLERRTIEVIGGLDGKTITIDGLSATMTDVLARVEHPSGALQIERLTPTRPSFEVAASQSLLERAMTYLRTGVEHILSGIDHLLFVLGLLLLVKGWKRVAATITAFTVAHSLTLAAATFGVIHVPSGPLEAAIAMSILFLGVEVVHQYRGQATLGTRYPWAIAFGFGLLHGCGFATGLATTGLPAGDIPFALLFFNLGVEIGQLAFVALVYALALAARTIGLAAPKRAELLPAYVVGTAGAYWTIAQTLPLIRAIT